MSQPNFNKHNPRSHRHRGKFQEEELNVMTLDEWEKRKTGSGVATTREHSLTSQDEDLARQLQEQFDLEDIHVIIFYLKNAPYQDNSPFPTKPIFLIYFSYLIYAGTKCVSGGHRY